MTKANYALRLQASLKAEAENIARAEGTTLNQFINVAVAEKISALRTSEYFRERAARADIAGALELLERAGDEPPWAGDAMADEAGPVPAGPSPVGKRPRSAR
ncbi:MAG: hypothetical protein R3285_09045 [Kiloniellales bacterium]|nr:hypothetical protein [Kiloniellales bacterium]